MSAEDPWPEAFLIQAVAQTIRDILLRRFGYQDFYATAQVQAAFDECQAPDSYREFAVAMFVRPGEADALLQHFSSSWSAMELRGLLAQQMFFDSMPDVSYETGMNCFAILGFGSSQSGRARQPNQKVRIDGFDAS
jgi:hypothetical protein